MRIASFNLENLFRRAKIFNLADSARSNELLGKVRDFATLLDQPSYTTAVKDQIALVSQGLSQFVDVRNDIGSLGSWRKADVTHPEAWFGIGRSTKGRADWHGELIFLMEGFDDVQRKNTALVVETVNADILCTIEVEGMSALGAFNRTLRGTPFAQYMSIDSPNDPRGIDVGCMSKYPIREIRTHAFDTISDNKTKIFSRDCLELSIECAANTWVHLLCNHFKSQSGGDEVGSAAKRLRQATAVAAILDRYNLKKDYVVVAGDLNEDSSSAFQSLNPLFNKPDLLPVIDPALPSNKRYTHYYKGAAAGEPKLTQLDYLFVSKALHKKITAFGFERRGIAGIGSIAAQEGADPIAQFPSVANDMLGASDHAAIWVDVDI